MVRPLRILHCFRAPVGGLFRHVCDLAQGQADAGYEVGLICDASTGGTIAEDRLRRIESVCALGVTRLAMSRMISVGDIAVMREIRGIVCDLDADIVHGHGAKGGAYARFAAVRRPPVSIYTPHGGSLHYSRRSPVGFVFLSLEKLLLPLTDGLVFESRYGQSVFAEKVGAPGKHSRVIPNGLHDGEFQPVTPANDATDILFIGELRRLKGVDLLLHALARLDDGNATATIVGSGPDEETFRSLARDLGLEARVSFLPPQPARDAFSRGRILVIPSRAESFPYIVLEAVAAAKPLIATDVGGIPEIYGDLAGSLVAPDSVEHLQAAMAEGLSDPSGLEARAGKLQERAGRLFSVQTMVRDISAVYRDAIRRSRPNIAAAVEPALNPPAGKDTA